MNNKYDDERMEEINFEVDDCHNDVNYFISRRVDPLSETMSKASTIDKNLKRSYKPPTTASSDDPIMWLVQQSLPRMEVPKFSGNYIKWVEFVIKFKELVHDQVYLTVSQKFIFLMQHVEGEAKRAIQVFSINRNGYIFALKRLKYMFGQNSQISQAYISKLTRGMSISNDDKVWTQLSHVSSIHIQAYKRNVNIK